ncbi:hypothetical protein [Nocardioides litoris]|uniref:hypothetical protein n=1 Tax=Nocardioides litoris TaxID=1926648 RepID=UPI0011211C61|nr:hypothetical protein [Nocardioides litoris]
MTDNALTDDQLTAVQAVIDRVSSWQDGATEGTLESEVRKGLDEVGLTLDDDQVAKVVAALEADKGEADARAALA